MKQCEYKFIITKTRYLLQQFELHNSSLLYTFICMHPEQVFQKTKQKEHGQGNTPLKEQLLFFIKHATLIHQEVFYKAHSLNLLFEICHESSMLEAKVNLKVKDTGVVTSATYNSWPWTRPNSGDGLNSLK